MLETTPGVPSRPVLRPADDREDPPRESRVRLLDVIPEMHAAVPADERLRAVQALTAPLVTVAAGEIALDGYDAARRPFALVVLDGLVLRRTVAGREAAGALGPGDVIDLETHDEDDTVLPVHTRYVAHRAATLAVLDDRFRLAAHPLATAPRRRPRPHGAAAPPDVADAGDPAPAARGRPARRPLLRAGRHGDQRQHVRQRLEQRRRRGREHRQPLRERGREAEQQRRHQRAARAPAPEDQRRQRDEALADGHVLRERVHEADREVRAARAASTPEVITAR